MSGLFWAGLTNGILGGYQAGENIANAQEDRERRARAAELEGQRQSELMGLKREELDLAKQRAKAEAENRAATLDLARAGLGLNVSRANSADAQQQIENQQTDAKLKLMQSEADREQQLFSIDLAAKRREAESKARLEKLPQVEAVLARWNTPGAEASPDDVALIRDVTGVDPAQYTDPGTVGRLKQTFEAVRAGKLDPNAPPAIEAARMLYDPYLQRGIGEPHRAPDGRIFTVDSKSWAGLMPVEDKGFGVRVHVQGKDAQGQPVDYYAPATIHGTSDDADDALLISPEMLETPAAMALILHHRYTTNPAVKAAVDASVQGMKGGKDAKTQSEIDLNRARADEARAKAAVAGKGKPGDVSKIMAGKMDDVEKYIEADLGDVTGSIAANQKGAAQAIRTQASTLLRQNPELTAEEAYDQARKAVAGAQAPASGQGQTAVYTGPRPWLKQ
jgi:hypothetical protein